MSTVETRGTARLTFLPIGIVLIAGSLIILIAQFMRYLFATPSGDGLNGGIALILPWLLLLVAGVLIAVTKGGLALALTAASGALTGAFAAPFVVDRLPGIAIPEAVWVLGSGRGSEALTTISQGTNTGINIAEWVAAVGMIMLFAFMLVSVRQLAPLVLGPARQSAFGIDTTVLLTIFAVIALSIGISGNTGELLPDIAEANVLGSFLELNVRTYTWVLPVVLWTALMIRQGGALAIGVSSGLVVTFLLLPALIDWVGNAIGEASPLYVQGGAEISPYDALDWTGAKPALGVLAVLLLLITLWWVLGVQAPETYRRVLANSGSPTNWLGVTAFVLSWFPVTAIPGIVLGHMSYDQIVDSDHPQRGLGLSRWAIILGYVTLGAAVAFVYFNFLGS